MLALIERHIPDAELALWASKDITDPVAAILRRRFPGLRIATYGRLAGRTLYVFLDERDLRISQDDLAARGITVKDRGPREALLVRDADYHSVFR